jgi:hypothetical protein
MEGKQNIVTRAKLKKFAGEFLLKQRNKNEIPQSAGERWDVFFYSCYTQSQKDI